MKSWHRLEAVDAIVAALAAQQAELADLMLGTAEDRWHATTRCVGWDIADVILHLAQTDEMATASATGRYPELMEEIAQRLGPIDSPLSVDGAAALMVEREQGGPIGDLRARWSSGAARLVEVLDTVDLSTRVPWVAGELSARTLATTRLAETWIHTGDVAEALGIPLVPTDRLRPIARLAWRTLPYAFASANRSMSGPVAFHLVSPAGEPWDFVPESHALTTVRGKAEDLCAVAARRVDPATTSLWGEGPDTEGVLALVRTYA
jgi:uncharacterized protein (TIGR03084 family)